MLALGASWFVLGVLLVPVQRRLLANPRRTSVRVEASDGVIRLDGKAVGRGGAIVGGLTLPLVDGTSRVILYVRYLALSAKPGPARASGFFLTRQVHLVAGSADDGRELLKAAGVLDGAQVASVTFAQPQEPWHLVLALLAGGVAATLLGGGRPSSTTQALCIGVCGGLYLLFVRHKVIVGDDGVEIRRVFGSRFVAIADVRDVRLDERALYVALRDGRTVRLGYGVRTGSGAAAKQAALARSLLGDRIREAMRVASVRAEGSEIVELRRGARTPQEWLAALRQVAAGATQYREGAIRFEDVEKIATDGSAPNELRVGAAIVLRLAEPERSRDLVRIAAEATAATEARTVLEAIAGAGGDEELGAALTRFERNVNRRA